MDLEVKHYMELELPKFEISTQLIDSMHEGLELHLHPSEEKIPFWIKVFYHGELMILFGIMLLFLLYALESDHDER